MVGRAPGFRRTRRAGARAGVGGCRILPERAPAFPTGGDAAGTAGRSIS